MCIRDSHYSAQRADMHVIQMSEDGWEKVHMRARSDEKTLWIRGSRSNTFTRPRLVTDMRRVQAHQISLPNIESSYLILLV